MELFQELNQKFQTLDRFRDIPNMGTMVSNRKTRGGRKGGRVFGVADGQFKSSGVRLAGKHMMCDFCK